MFRCCRSFFAAQAADQVRKLSVREALRSAIDEELARDERVCVMGEEVELYNGPYKITKDLHVKYPGRIRDTPISEMGFTGIGVGAAMGGLRPIVEFMSFNFSLQAIDQIINSAAKARYMSGGLLSCPIVFRGPNSFGPGVAAQHSQCLAPYYAAVPGLKVFSVWDAEDARGMMKAAVRDDNPTIVLENELLYSEDFDVPENSHIRDVNFTIPFGKVKVVRPGKDISIFAHGKAVKTALKAAKELAQSGVDAEVVNLRSIRPLDIYGIIASVKKTHRAITVEESFPVCSVGSEVLSIISESEAFFYLDSRMERIACADVPMPYANDLEVAATPQVHNVVSAALRVINKSLPTLKR